MTSRGALLRAPSYTPRVPFDGDSELWLLSGEGGDGWQALRTVPLHEAGDVADTLAALRARPHPGVTRVHAADVRGDTFGWIEDLAPGETLRVTLSRACHTRAPYSPRESARRGARLASALAHLRRCAPRPGHVDLLDARESPGGPILCEGWRAGRNLASARSEFLVRPTTMRHLAPERVVGGVEDERSDVWAVGAVLYEHVFAEHAFPGATDLACLERIVEGIEPRRLREPGEVPPALVALLARALTPDPAGRHASLDELSRALEVLAGEQDTVGGAYRADPRGGPADPRGALAEAASAQDLARFASLFVDTPWALRGSFAGWCLRALAAPLFERLREGRSELADAVILCATRSLTRDSLEALLSDARTSASSVAILEQLLGDAAVIGPL